MCSIWIQCLKKWIVEPPLWCLAPSVSTSPPWETNECVSVQIYSQQEDFILKYWNYSARSFPTKGRNACSHFYGGTRNGSGLRFDSDWSAALTIVLAEWLKLWSNVQKVMRSNLLRDPVALHQGWIASLCVVNPPASKRDKCMAITAGLIFKKKKKRREEKV